MSKFWNTDSGW